MLALWLALEVARADDLDDWQRLQRAQLYESLGDLPEAIATYERLLTSSGMSADNPLRSRVLYRLASALYTAGRTEQAKRALAEAVRTPSSWREPCQLLLERITLDETSLRNLPVTWTFDGDAPSFAILHPTAAEDKGRSFAIDAAAPGGDGALAWTTTVSARKDDWLVIGLVDPRPAPRGVRFQVLAGQMPAVLRLVAYDTDGTKFTSGTVAVLNGAWSNVDIPLRELHSETGATPEATRLDRLELHDNTGAFMGATTGHNVLWLDDFEIYVR